MHLGDGLYVVNYISLWCIYSSRNPVTRLSIFFVILASFKSNCRHLKLLLNRFLILLEMSVVFSAEMFRMVETFDNWNFFISEILCRGGSRAAATSKMECFVIVVNGFKLLTIITKHSILDVAAALDPPLLCYHSLKVFLFTYYLARKFRRIKHTSVKHYLGRKGPYLKTKLWLC